MSKARDLANLASDTTLLATDVEVLAASSTDQTIVSAQVFS